MFTTECSVQPKVLEVFCPAFDSICYLTTIRISTEFRISSIATESLKLHSHCYNDQALVAILSAVLMADSPTLSVLDIVVDSTMMES